MERKKVELKFFSEPDMMQAGVLDVASCVEVMDDTFKLLGQGDFVMGGYNQSSHGCMLWYPKDTPFPNMPKAGPDRRYMAMPAYVGGRYNCCGVKWYGSNVSNPKERGLPRSILLVCLNDPVTGAAGHYVGQSAQRHADGLRARRRHQVPGTQGGTVSGRSGLRRHQPRLRQRDPVQYAGRKEAVPL